jgi:lipoyl(octanoyl) transferase
VVPALTGKLPMVEVTWNFCATGEGTGAANMQFDEGLVTRLVQGVGLPTLRTYRWRPWAISIGHHQHLSDIDLDRCRDDGIDVVRRATGGRAILHAEELTYSVVMPVENKGIHQVYNEISSALVEGLKMFGVEVSLQRSQPNFAELYKNPSSIPCFSSSARSEIEWNGRKLVGSAQRRYSGGEGDVVLQHGSILCGSAHRRLADYLVLEDQHIRDNVRTDLKEKTADVREISGRPVDYEELSDCIKKGFESAWGVAFANVPLN